MDAKKRTEINYDDGVISINITTITMGITITITIIMGITTTIMGTITVISLCNKRLKLIFAVFSHFSFSEKNENEK